MKTIRQQFIEGSPHRRLCIEAALVSQVFQRQREGEDIRLANCAACEVPNIVDLDEPEPYTCPICQGT